MQNLMNGKKGLIMGLINDSSLAYGISSSLFEQGAELAFTYQGEVVEKRLRPLATKFNSDILIECDVSKPGHIQNVFKVLEEKWGKIDFVVHAIAYSDKNELRGEYLNTTLDNFLNTMNISCYSFTEVCREASKIMNENGSLVTLTYYGAEKVMPHYNVMGVAKAALEASVRYLAVDLGTRNIRVNALSAGPVKTLAASGIGDFNYILKWNMYNSPLRRNTTLSDVGGSALYLLSDLASGVTGEVHHVDSGYHVVGMKNVDAPDLSPGQKNNT
ncbi:MAG: enoyl-[acyl-carrier-protein] reductase FabI [Candidatus Puniceispirillum sp.]|nr:enoyl-[acyl-carrier-protein] reductase FabI [Candidatus Pelagibacter sp.]MBA4283704.1 enoyl-[acyl-carrier-protein] reductase FabI [Candidatus Puniceispirillum sp.]